MVNSFSNSRWFCLCYNKSKVITIMGTEPFLKTDPTSSDQHLHKITLCPTLLRPVLFCVGIQYVNYMVNTIQLVLQGREVFSVGKLWLPLHFALSSFDAKWEQTLRITALTQRSNERLSYSQLRPCLQWLETRKSAKIEGRRQRLVFVKQKSAESSNEEDLASERFQSKQCLIEPEWLLYESYFEIWREKAYI